MPPIAWLPLASYVLISTFTPGPSNIASSSLAMLHGFRRTVTFQVGLALGVGLMMVVGGLVSASLLSGFPALEPVLRYVGAAYILYLAYGLLRASYTFTERPAAPLGFWHGLLLQISNPKLVVYALTLFASFLAPLVGNPLQLVAAAVLLALVSACSTIAWALLGAQIKRRLSNPRWARWINIILALGLVFAALDLTGLLAAVK
jgi:cysteine/O-acetylserine efflux protein